MFIHIANLVYFRDVKTCSSAIGTFLQMTESLVLKFAGFFFKHKQFLQVKSSFRNAKQRNTNTKKRLNPLSTYITICTFLLFFKESDPLLRLALRRATYSTNEFSTFSLQASPFVWQHRTKVTFEHFVQEFHVMKRKEFINKNKFFVLENFLHQVFEHLLIFSSYL